MSLILLSCSILGVEEIIFACLRRDPSLRMSACQAAITLFVMMNAPRDILKMNMARINGEQVVNRFDAINALTSSSCFRSYQNIVSKDVIRSFK